MAEVFKREGSSFYWYAFTINGKRFRGSTKRTRKKDATEVARKLEESHRARVSEGSDLPELTLEEALGFLSRKHRTKPKAHVHYSIRKICNQMSGVQGIDPDTPFHKVTRSMLRDYVERRQEQGAANSTINQEINTVSAAYNMVAGDYRVREGLKVPRLPVQEIPRPLTEPEVQQLLDKLDPDKPIRGRNGTTYVPSESYGGDPVIIEQKRQNRDFVIALLHSGARVGEMASLRWDQVAEDCSSFRILRTKTKSKVGATSYFGELRSSKIMQDMLLSRRGRTGNNPYVFPAWKRTEPSHIMIRDAAPMRSTMAIRRAMDSIGINSEENVKRYGRRDVRSLRDTFATRMVQRGMPLEVVSKILGHASIKQTMKYAAFRNSDAADRAVEVLDSMGQI